MTDIPPLPPTALSDAPLGVEIDPAAKAHPLTAPLNVSKIRKESGVKDLIKRLLNYHGWFTWMPAANGYGAQGVCDHLALKDGIFIAIEAKFGTNKPSALQCSFAGQIIANGCFAFCVNERNIDHLAYWLESFQFSIAWQQAGNDPETLPQEHGSRLLNAIAALTEPFNIDAKQAIVDGDAPAAPAVPFL